MTSTNNNKKNDELEIDICPDFHTCRNGAKCVESNTRQGSYYCDCDVIHNDLIGASYAGISCEHASTIYCNNNNDKSYTSFCTNKATCKINNRNVDEEHKGCNCPSPYTGDVSQFDIIYIYYTLV